LLAGAAPGAGAAVVSTSGKVEQADGALGERHAVREIGSAARAIGKARGALRRTDPAHAVEIWRSLVDGRWSLVDSFVENGQQYLVAKENSPPALEPGAHPLSPRQRQMLFFVAQGHSNKVIAYELGISESTVATHLRRAMSAMKCGSRLELVQRARGLMAATA
jgi:DNA-binding NarL/FixJ family response regulator